MPLENQKESVPFVHYAARFRTLQPGETVLRLPDVGYAAGEFRVTLLGREFALSHPEYAIRATDGGAVPPLPVQTFLLRYLLESRAHPQSGWKTFRELPWGETYNKAYSGRVLTRAAFRFGGRPEAFRAACESMGAVPVPHGDAGYEFRLLGQYRMQLLIWQGDEEFPPSAQILYSDNFALGFTAEDRVVAGDILISAIGANML